MCATQTFLLAGKAPVHIKYKTKGKSKTKQNEADLDEHRFFQDFEVMSDIV